MIENAITIFEMIDRDCYPFCLNGIFWISIKILNYPLGPKNVA
jgi:hypothetical protein